MPDRPGRCTASTEPERHPDHHRAEQRFRFRAGQSRGTRIGHAAHGGTADDDHQRARDLLEGLLFRNRNLADDVADAPSAMKTSEKPSTKNSDVTRTWTARRALRVFARISSSETPETNER